MSVQDPLVTVPGTTKVALAGLNGETLGAGTVESPQALFSSDKRVTSLVAQKDKTQVMLGSQSISLLDNETKHTGAVPGGQNCVKESRESLASCCALPACPFSSIVWVSVIMWASAQGNNSKL